MLIKQSIVHLLDNSNIRLLKIFQLYGGFFRKKTKIGFYSKGSAKLLKRKVLNRKIKKGNILKNYILRQKYVIKKIDSSSLNLSDNSIILIKKKNIPRYKYFIGAIPKNIKNKKYQILFKDLL